MFVNLLEYCSGKSIDQLLSDHNVSINKNAFSDTADYNVLACNALGIINGIGGGKFGPDDTLQRAQIAAIINRVARTLGKNTDGYSHPFTDVSGHWCSPELGWPVANGVINGIGDNKFDPNTELSVEQAICITYRAVKPLYYVRKANDALKELKSLLKNPASLQVHSVRVYIYDAAAGHMTPIEIDYSAMNSLGGYNRNYYIYFYEGAFGNHSAKSTLGNSLRSDIKYQTIEIDLSLLNIN